MPSRPFLALLGLFLPTALALFAAARSAPPPHPGDRAEGPAVLVHPYLQLPTPTGMTVMWETNRRLPGHVEFGTTPDLGRVAGSAEPSVLHEVRLEGLQPATAYYYRVRSGGLASGVHSFRSALPAGTKRWRMAVYGDSRSNPATHRKVAELIERARPELIVHTGDIVANGKNHDSWRQEFFDPLGPLARSVPWVSTIGNHERDSDNYFSYMALPGNERYFSLEFANADIVCLNSNSWIERGRDSQQFQWLTEHLGKPRPATWTFVVFHHPLFSAHATRPINPLRWDWAPVFLDPANRVDGVLTGHDHFYARDYRMGRVAQAPQPGVLFLTTAGGGASLYRTRARDYVAREKSVHHATFFDFDGDRVTITAVDITGREIDRYVLTKEPTSAEAFCAYEVEEVRQMLRLALAGAAPVRLPDDRTRTIDTSLRVPTHFDVPMTGRFAWQDAPGWRLPKGGDTFHLEPGERLTIPLRAEVAGGPFPQNPALTIRFDAGKFRNRSIDLAPFQLAGPAQVQVAATHTGPAVDGKLNEPSWRSAPSYALLGLPPQGGRADQVRFLADPDWLYVGVRADDPSGKVRVKSGQPEEESSRLVLVEEHVRVMLSDGKQVRTFAVTPGQVHYSNPSSGEQEPGWQAAAAQAEGGWSVEMALPRRLVADWSRVRVNVVHHRQEGKAATELQLCPSYKMGNDPDRLPDFQPADLVERLALLQFN
jgi:hypothetical protein